MRRHDDDFEPVDLLELECLGVSGTRHARELGVHAEIVLEGDGRDSLVLFANPHALLCLDGLMQAVGPAATLHGAAGELVDDDDLAVAHDVLDVAVVQRVGSQCGIQVMHQPDVRGVIQALPRLQQTRLQEQVLDPLVARVGQMHLPALLVCPEVALAFFRFLALEPRGELVDLEIELGALLGRTGNDEGRAGFVDEDGIHFVDDRIDQRTLGAILESEGEVVAQVIEAEFVVRAVGDVRRIGRTLFCRALAALDHANLKAQEAKDGRHPVGVTLGEVLVDRHHVDALGGQRIQVGGKRRDQRLAFAGAHLGDLALMQHHAADQLHIEMTHAERTLGRLADGCKRLRQQLVQGRTLGDALPELGSLGLELIVAQGGQ